MSAASPDIVSEASPPFHEVRHAGSLTGGYKPGIFGVQANADISSEPDYFALGGGLAMLAELHDKLITPRIAWNYGHDTIGRLSTPFNVFHHTLATNEFEAGTTFVLSSRSLLLINGTLQLERGDQSKPYRYVPMFEPGVASSVKPGQSIAAVNSARINVRPLEQLPTERNRYAVGLRFAHNSPAARCASKSVSITIRGSKPRPPPTCASSWTSASDFASGRTGVSISRTAPTSTSSRTRRPWTRRRTRSRFLRFVPMIASSAR